MRQADVRELAEEPKQAFDLTISFLTSQHFSDRRTIVRRSLQVMYQAQYIILT